MKEKSFLAAACAWFLFCAGSFLFRAHLLNFAAYPPLPSWSLLTAAFLVRAAASLLRLALFWAAAWRVGAWILPALGGAALRRGERALCALGLGAGTLGLAAFGLGVAGALNGRVLSAGLALLAAAALAEAVQAARRVDRRGLNVPAPSAEAAAPLVFLAAAAAYQFLVALGPTTYYDSLTYHLALPDLYLHRGALVATPMNAYAGIPQGVQMLYLWMLPLGGGGTGCQVLHWSLGLLAAGAVVALARRLGKTTAGLWAAALFFASPMVLIESGRAAAELGWSFYVALTLLVLAALDETPDRALLWLAGVFTGLALGTKYQAVFLLPAAAAWLVHRRGWREAARPALTVALIAVAVAAPWGLRNIAFYRNPVFPFGGSLFAPSELIDLPSFMTSAHGRSALAVFTRWDAFQEFLLHPWTYAMTPAGEAENILSFAFLAAVPLLPFLRLSAPVRRLLIAGALLWLPVNLLSGIARFSIPALVPLSLALALALDGLPPAGEMLRTAAACVTFAFSLFYVHSTIDPLLWTVLSGRLPDAAYLAHQRPSYFAPPFAAYAWINAALPKDARVLLVGEPRSFYLDRDLETASSYAVPPIVAYANASASGDALYRKLREAGVTHICFNFMAAQASRQVMRMSEGGLESLRQFWSRDLAAVHIDSSHDPADLRLSVVYRLLSEEEIARPHPSIDVPFGQRR